MTITPEAAAWLAAERAAGCPWRLGSVDGPRCELAHDHAEPCRFPTA